MNLGEEELDLNGGNGAGALGGILASAPKGVANVMALVRNNGRFFPGERGAGGSLPEGFMPTQAQLAAEIRRTYPHLNRPGKNDTWAVNAAHGVIIGEQQAARSAAVAAAGSLKRKAKGRAGSKGADKRGKGPAREERRQEGGARRRRRTARKSRKAHKGRKHTRKH
jgi:hypothetical protein